MVDGPSAPAPATPAPAAPAAPGSTQPGTLSPLTATQEASNRAREMMAAGTLKLADAIPPEKPRAENGQFAPVVPNRPVEATNPAEGDEVGVTDDAASEGPPEGEEGTQEEGQEGEGEDQPLKVTIPGRNENEEFDMVVESPEAAERLRQLVNGYQRGEAIRAEREQIRQQEVEVEQQFQKIAEVRDQLTIDPEGFVAEGLPPEEQQTLALYLLTRPDVWRAVQPLIEQIVDDPDKLAIAQSRLEAQRYQKRDERRQVAEHRARINENARQVRTAAEAIIPETMPAEQAKFFYQDALRDLKEHADRNNLDAIHPADVPVIIANRLRQYGINPIVAQERIAAMIAQGGVAKAQGRPSTGTGAASAKPAGKTGAAKPAAAPARTGKEFVARAGQRRQVAATAPGGAGSPSATPMTPPPNQSIEERSKWFREQVAKNKAGLPGAAR